jgi:TRAP transporter TAXI family solute receptor
MKKYLALVIIFGLLLAWTIEETKAQQLPPVLSIGTSSVGSFQYVASSAVASVISKYTPMKATVRSMAGTAAWFPLIATKDLELGMLNNWEAEKGYFGESIYTKLSGGKGFSIRLVAVGIWNSISSIVAGDSGIYKISDLRGKRVAGNYPTVSFQLQTEALLANGGVKWSEIIPVSVSTLAEGIKAVIEGRADAAGTIRLGVPLVEELYTKRGARFLPLDPSPEAMKRVYEKFPGYPVKVAPGPGNRGIEKEQYMYAFDDNLIGREDLPDEAVYLIVKALWENYKDLGSVHVLLKDWTPQRFVSNKALIPYHPGAIKFYKEKGVWTDEMVKLQEALLAKKK